VLSHSTAVAPPCCRENTAPVGPSVLICLAAQATVAGRNVPTDRAQRKWAFGFPFHGAPVDGVEVPLVLDQHADDVTVRVADSTHDLGLAHGFTPPALGRVLVTPEMKATRAFAF
jgi:hypothetical protein